MAQQPRLRKVETVTNRVIQGTYADFKIVKTRNVAQLIIEVPLEEAQSAIQMFGVPTPQKEQWVAVAALHEVSVESNSEDGRKAIVSSQMLCRSDKFGNFLREQMGMGEVQDTDESRAQGLRAILGITSRSELGKDQASLQAFYRIKGEYDQWAMQI